MREAVFVSYARTGLAKAGRGGFNMTPAMSMAAHAIKHAVAKSGVEPADVEDVSLGKFRYWSHRFLRTRLGARSLGRFQDTDSDNERRYRKELYRRVRSLA